MRVIIESSDWEHIAVGDVVTFSSMSIVKENDEGKTPIGEQVDGHLIDGDLYVAVVKLHDHDGHGLHLVWGRHVPCVPSMHGQHEGVCISGGIRSLPGIDVDHDHDHDRPSVGDLPTSPAPLGTRSHNGQWHGKGG